MDKENNESRYKVDKYIKYQYFSILYGKFITNMGFENKDLFSGDCKYLFASVIACIEGNVNVDCEEKSWCLWNMEKNEMVKKICLNSCVLKSICDYVKSNSWFYDFITKYFNVWHDSNNPEFVYDIFHKSEMEDNIKQLILIIRKDIETALLEHDNYIVETFNKLHDQLNSLFDCSKEISC